MRRGIMVYNSRRYAKLDSKRPRMGKPIAGFWDRLGHQGMVIYTLEREPFAFVSTNGEKFVVDAERIDGRVRFSTSVSGKTLDRLGFGWAMFGEERDAINSIRFS